MAKRTVKMTIRMSQSEAYALQEISNEKNIPMSILVRECTLTDFSDQQVYKRVDDIFQYSQAMYEIDKAVNEILKSIGSENLLFSRELDKIGNLISEINSIYNLNFKKIEKVRDRIANAVSADIKRNKDTYFQKYIEPSNEPLEIKYTLWLTEEEHKIIKEMAAKEEVSISSLLKNNVFKKCVKKRSLISSYSLDLFIPEIEKKTKTLKAIALTKKEEMVTELDMNNVISILLKVRETNVEINNSILDEQKDIKREARRILKERRIK